MDRLVASGVAGEGPPPGCADLKAALLTPLRLHPVASRRIVAMDNECRWRRTSEGVGLRTDQLPNISLGQSASLRHLTDRRDRVRSVYHQLIRLVPLDQGYQNSRLSNSAVPGSAPVRRSISASASSWSVSFLIGLMVIWTPPAYISARRKIECPIRFSSSALRDRPRIMMGPRQRA